MRCPYCGFNQDKVVDSRLTSEGLAIRRRRECNGCGRRFTTYEYVEKTPLMVIKKDGRREPFSQQKILDGLIKACEKRAVSVEKLENMVAEIEIKLQKKFEQEVESNHIGELVMEKLSRLDDVAYVRFASVYRQFKDINQFLRELREVLGRKINK
ncbi:MAG: transcriptional regulator NrdR [Candidatus Omnitrophica bacterium]|nr:transcriptional regulator NrdR [Candidatus Omnitrophota bacterium]MCF7891730.1 transcriptional regulator NrdR [Candidatus Omnitrophota bacterium]MCF7896224.1 transcriptional regulator NrdR [Candidatus Omnitrophota bacterium]MCF7897527.1 transcriptional regulator NrdR [Candidatus Omnitrophota bacterium]MCF7909090.1 transcriptional regulator NrdR [Candidatus Omnitrophota bacterium]